MSLYIRDPDMNLLEISNKIQNITVEKMFHFIVGGMFYKKVGVTWRVSDCEELVGVAHMRWWDLFLVVPKALISWD